MKFEKIPNHIMSTTGSVIEKIGWAYAGVAAYSTQVYWEGRKLLDVATVADKSIDNHLNKLSQNALQNNVDIENLLPYGSQLKSGPYFETLDFVHEHASHPTAYAVSAIAGITIGYMTRKAAKYEDEQTTLQSMIDYVDENLTKDTMDKNEKNLNL